MTDKPFDFEHTRYGFRWGPLHVTRIFSDPKAGVVIEVGAGNDVLEIRASPGGRKLQVTRKGKPGGDNHE